MPSAVENRVVSMEFNNSKFGTKVQETLGWLKKLEEGLQLSKAQSGLKGISSAAQQVDLGTLANKVDQVVQRFTGLQAVGTGALLAIGNAAVAAAQKMVSNMTAGIRDGFGEYETEMGSMTTILANTSMKYGTTVADVTKSLAELNTYSDKTIYSFGDMTRNIGLFTNAGLKLETSTSMIKGFSNAAAASGTTSQGAAGAAYQLSQALSAGKITLMDWRSLTNVGMGNANMKQGIIDIAQAMGTFKTAGIESTAAQKDFNGSLEKGWLTADVMSNYLQIMSGDMSDAAMKSIGLSDAQIASFKQQQAQAEDAATKVRTFTQLVGTLSEAVGSGWSQTWKLLIGDYTQATKLFTDINNVLGDMVKGSAAARNEMVKGFVDGGGRDAIINSVKNIWSAIESIWKPIAAAFDAVFPKSGPPGLLMAVKAFEKFTQVLKPTDAVMKLIQISATGAALAWKTLLQIGGMLVNTITDIMRVVKALGNFFATLLAPIGDVVAALVGFGPEGIAALNNFFDFLGELRTKGIDALVEAIDNATASLGGWTSNVEGFAEWIRNADLLNKLAGAMGIAWEAAKAKFQDLQGLVQQVFEFINNSLKQAPGNASSFGEAFKAKFQEVLDILEKIKNGAMDFGTAAKDAISGFVKYMQDALKNFDPLMAVSLANTAVMFAMGKKIIDLFGKKNQFNPIKESLITALDSISSAFEALQEKLEPNKLKQIGIAILAVSAGLYILAQIDPDRLQSAGIALAMVVGSLALVMGMMKLFKSADSFIGQAAGLVILSVAILILSQAVKILAGLPLEQVAMGVAAISVMLLVMAAAVKLMGDPEQLIATGVGITLIAGAINILSLAVIALGVVPYEVLRQGLTSVVILLLALVIAVQAMGDPNNMLKTGAGLLLIALALQGMSAAVVALGLIPYETLRQGLTSVILLLLALSVAVVVMNNSKGGAAAILAIAIALAILVPSIILLGLIPFDVLAQGLIVLGLALMGLVIASNMISAGGSAGLLMIGLAILAIAVALAVLSAIPWDAMQNGLKGLAVIFVMLGIAMIGLALLSLLAPQIMTLAIALGVLGVALLLIGAAAVVFGIGLGLMSAGIAAAAGSFSLLGNALLALAPQADQLALMAGVMVLLGAGFLAAGVGALVLGAGLVVLGIGMMLAATFAAPAAIGLKLFTDAVVALLPQALALGAMAATFTALGAALVVLGAGMITVSVGAMALVLALLAINLAAPITNQVMSELSAGLQNLGAAAPAMTEFGVALTAMGVALAAAGASALAAVAGLGVLTVELIAIGVGALTAAAGIAALGLAMSTSAGVFSTGADIMGQAAASATQLILSSMAMLVPGISSSMTESSAAVTTGSVSIMSGLGTLAPGVTAASGAISAAALLITAVFVTLGTTASAAVTVAAGLVGVALATIPGIIGAAAAVITVSTLLIVKAFSDMGPAAGVAIAASGAIITTGLNAVAASVGVAALSIGANIVAGVVNGIKNGIPSVISAAATLASSALSAAKSALGIASPSKEFEKIGKFADEGLAKGIRGNADEVEEAMDDLNDMMSSKMKDLNKRIRKAQDKVDQYARNPRRYAAALAKARQDLAELKAYRDSLKATDTWVNTQAKTLNKQIQDARTEIAALAAQMDDAKAKIAEAVKIRDDAAAKFSDDYDDMLDFGEDTTYESYIRDMTELIDKTNQYRDALSEMHRLGLSDEIYNKLVETGVDALPFVEDVLNQGEFAVKNLNTMADQLDTAADKFGTSAAYDLYQSGVNAAQGFLDGLIARQNELEAQIEGWANLIVNTVKDKLGIHSPSRVMRALGQNTGEGLAEGLKDMQHGLTLVAKDLAEQFQKDADNEFNGINLDFDSDVNRPVIAPVMDLSDIKSGAAAIEAMLKNRYAVDMAATASNMASVSSSASAKSSDTSSQTPVNQLNYTQNNYSPKAIGAAETYRNTQNQLSRTLRRLTTQ